MMKTLRLLMLTLLMAVTGTALADTWVKTSPANLQSGDEVAIVDLTSGTAMSNNNGTSSAPSATVVTLNADNSEVTGMTTNLVWTVTVADGKYKFGTGESFLYCTNSNNGVRVGTNENNLFSFKQSEEGVDFLFNEATSRYIGVYNTQDWRCYTSINNNIKATVIAFYKKTAGGGEVTLEDPKFKFTPDFLTATIGQDFTEPELSYAEGFDGTVKYSIDPASGVATINASTGKLTLVAAGTATVTASSEKTSKFIAGTATYALTVKEAPAPVTDAIWAEDWQTSKAGDKVEDVVNAAATYTGDDGGFIKIYASSTDDTNMELLVPKSSRKLSFQADIDLKGESGNLDLTFTCNKTLSVTSSTSGVSVVAGSDAYTYTIVVPAGTAKLNLTFETTTDSNARLDDLKLVKSDNQDPPVVEKKDPELAFNSSSLTVTMGDTFTEPELTNKGDGAVTYSIDKSEVATIDAATGKLTLVAAGTATVTAKSAETANYKEGTASYTLTVNKQTQNTEPFLETFDQIEGTGGNDDAFSGTIATSGLTAEDPTDETWTTLEKAYEGKQCAKFGTGSADGKMTTRAIGISGEGGLTFRAAGWGSGSNTLTVTVEGATLEGASKITLSNGEWKNYTLGLKNGNGNVTVTFEGKRGFIDDIMVKSGAVVIKKEAEFEFSSDKLDVTIGEDFTEPELKYAEGFDGTVTYSIEPATGVATIDAATGKLTIIAAGTATVTASSAETDNFYAGKASYLLSVVDAAVTYDIAGIKGIGDDKTGVLKFEDAQVLYKGKNDMYVKDKSGAIDFFRTTNFSYETGQILNGTAKVTFKNYNGLPEITAVADADVTATAGTATPTAVSDLADVTLEKYVCDLVTVTGTLKIDGKNYYVTDGTIDLMIYDKFDLFTKNNKLPDAVEGSAVTATGIVVVFQNKPEVALTELDIESEIITVDISGAGFATLYYSDKNLKVPDGVTAFTCKANSATKTLESKEYSVIPAGSAVVLKAAQGSYNFVVTVTADEKDNENMLMGSDVAATTEAPREGDYKFFMLADDEELGVGFFPGAKNCGPFTSGAHKAYLAVPASMAADYYTFDFLDGIKGVTLPATINADSEIYTLSGMRVKASDLKKGVYIVNGSKIIIK